MSNRDRGKRAEKVVAQRLGGKRVGTMGGEDVSHAIWSVESKSRKAFVASAWMDQACRNCPDGKTPLVIVHVHGSRHDKDLVIMKMKDFEDYLGGVK